MWNPKEKAKWVAIPEIKLITVRNINDILSITIHNRESDNKIMVSLLDTKQKLLWTMNEYQLFDLCQYLVSEINDKIDQDGKDIVLQATMKIYEICGLQKNINENNSKVLSTDKIDEIISYYKDIIAGRQKTVDCWE